MASLCERGEAFITCHCDLFAPWTGFKRGPTNFIGVNLATFSRTLYGMEPLTLHFSFEISKERERVCVCLRERERRGRSFLFSAKYENNSWRSRMGRQAAEVKNWKIGVSSSVISKMKFGVNFFYGRCEICLLALWAELKEGKRYRVYFYWSSVIKGYVSQIPKYNGSHGKYLNTILQESLFLYAKIWMKCIWNIDYRWSISLHR